MDGAHNGRCARFRHTSGSRPNTCPSALPCAPCDSASPCMVSVSASRASRLPAVSDWQRQHAPTRRHSLPESSQHPPHANRQRAGGRCRPLRRADETCRLAAWQSQPPWRRDSNGAKGTFVLGFVLDLSHSLAPPLARSPLSNISAFSFITVIYTTASSGIHSTVTTPAPRPPSGQPPGLIARQLCIHLHPAIPFSIQPRRQALGARAQSPERAQSQAARRPAGKQRAKSQASELASCHGRRDDGSSNQGWPAYTMPRLLLATKACQ